jgi:acylphosphatase
MGSVPGVTGSSTQRRLWLQVQGRVQGVFFRASTREQAQRLGLAGWVRNLPDGSVEVLAEGEEASLRRLADWCRRGPPGAHVDEVEESWHPATGELSGFSIRY